VQSSDERRSTAGDVVERMEKVGRYAERVAVWKSDRIQSVGGPDQVLADPSVVRDVIGV